MNTENISLSSKLDNILIIDDHQLLLDSFSLLLQHHYNFTSILVANSVENSFNLLEQEQGISLIILDLDMPGLNGHDFMVAFKEKNYAIPIVVLSSSKNILEIKSILNLGAMGFIPKAHSAQRIIEGLNCILKGDIYIPEEIKFELANSSQTNGAISITKRQLEVLDMMHQGLSNKQIAHQLHISEGTVKFHISNMFGIFKAQNRVDCVQSARELGFIK